MEKPNCYQCIYKREVDGSCHSSCANRDAIVTGHEHGKRNGWFMHPYNFDPVWLLSCTGFSKK